MKNGEGELICDFAETYGIYDYKKMPLRIVAELAAGLRENSRLMLRRAGLKYPFDSLLLAAIVDRLSLLLWINTQNGVKGKARPKSILDVLLDNGRDVSVNFASGRAFDIERERIMREIRENGNSAC